MFIKNSDGKPDAMLTFAFISFSVVTFNLFLSTFGTINVHGQQISFQLLDSSVMGAYLGATFTAYVSRRWTDKHYNSSTPTNPPDSGV
jgi:hypothetical protein